MPSSTTILMIYIQKLNDAVYTCKLLSQTATQQLVCVKLAQAESDPLADYFAFGTNADTSTAHVPCMVEAAVGVCRLVCQGL